MAMPPRAEGNQTWFYSAFTGSASRIYKHIRVVRLLLSKDGIQVNKPDDDGETPLSYALTQGRKQVVQLLREEITSPMNANSTCIVCLDCKTDVVLEPCGYQNLCGPCAHQWNKEQNPCPLDRTKIWKVLPLKRKVEYDGEDTSSPKKIKPTKYDQ